MTVSALLAIILISILIFIPLVIFLLFIYFYWIWNQYYLFFLKNNLFLIIKGIINLQENNKIIKFYDNRNKKIYPFQGKSNLLKTWCLNIVSNNQNELYEKIITIINSPRNLKIIRKYIFLKINGILYCYSLTVTKNINNTKLFLFLKYNALSNNKIYSLFNLPYKKNINENKGKITNKVLNFLPNARIKRILLPKKVQNYKNKLVISKIELKNKQYFNKCFFIFNNFLTSNINNKYSFHEKIYFNSKNLKNYLLQCCNNFELIEIKHNFQNIWIFYANSYKKIAILKKFLNKYYKKIKQNFFNTNFQEYKYFWKNINFNIIFFDEFQNNNSEIKTVLFKLYLISQNLNEKNKISIFSKLDLHKMNSEFALNKKKYYLNNINFKILFLYKAIFDIKKDIKFGILFNYIFQQKIKIDWINFLNQNYKKIKFNDLFNKIKFNDNIQKINKSILIFLPITIQAFIYFQKNFQLLFKKYPNIIPCFNRVDLNNLNLLNLLSKINCDYGFYNFNIIEYGELLFQKYLKNCKYIFINETIIKIVLSKYYYLNKFLILKKQSENFNIKIIIQKWKDSNIFLKKLYENNCYYFCEFNYKNNLDFNVNSKVRRSLLEYENFIKIRR